ncbi:MAG: DNA cytosine methyltransferase [Ruminococcus sp.]|nr:DNA cytosine methyltransferase [Ruminococcus sp.]
MKVLIACEESQRVCIAFRKRGHEAYSCDIQECSGGHPEWHVQGDVIRLINGNCRFTTADLILHEIDSKWDLLIAHPPCTYLSNAGNRYLNTDVYGEKATERYRMRETALEFFIKFCEADCDRICVENPVGYASHYRKADQIIQPYYFAKSADDIENYHVKTTCLWLKNLPLLEYPDKLPKPEAHHTRPNGNKVYFVESISCQKQRSKTFPGIAEAMAEQWGNSVSPISPICRQFSLLD